jgi:HEPN domain-containing protein
VCFHAQQASEKALKAVLRDRTIEFPLIHDIEALVDIAEKAGLHLPPEFDEAGFLTPFAVESRYPGYGEEITQSDVEEAIRLAEAIVSWAVSLIPSPPEGGEDRGEGEPRGDEGSPK